MTSFTVNFHYFDAFFNLSYTKDSGLGLVDDDRRGNQAARDTMIGYRKGTITDIFRFQLILPGASGQVGDARGDSLVNPCFEHACKTGTIKPWSPRAVPIPMLM